MTPRQFLAHSIACTLSVMLASCASMQSFRPEALPADANEEIVVFAHDGRVIKFPESEYTIEATDSGRVIVGEGRRYTDSTRTHTARFSGRINLAKADSVQVRTFSTAANTAGLIIAVSGVAFVVLLVLLMSSHLKLG